MNCAVVGIGSNIHPYHYIAQALDILSEEHHLVGISRFVQTTPLGFTSQPDFINGACMVKTEYSAETFALYLKDVEKRLDRIKTIEKNGPRTIDLDIVIWNTTIINNDYYTREFVRKAVTEVLTVEP